MRYPIIFLALSLLACGREPQPQQVSSRQPSEPPPPCLPAVVTGPEGDTVSLAGDSAVIVYLWLPLSGHPPTESDLQALAGIADAGRARVLPIQLSPQARNEAQTQVNGLGLSMPVYLADSCILDTLANRQLPAVLLLTPGQARASSGFGAPNRLLLSSTVSE